MLRNAKKLDQLSCRAKLSCSIILIILTIDVSTMILNDIDARSVSSVPDADAEVPAPRHEQIWHLGIPQQSTYRAGVSVKDPYRSAVLRVIPHPHSTTNHDPKHCSAFKSRSKSSDLSTAKQRSPNQATSAHRAVLIFVSAAPSDLWVAVAWWGGLIQ